jgi:hypothetical protein
MLTLLGGERWVDGLAGVPRLYTRLESETPPDVLNLIDALHACVSGAGIAKSLCCGC